MTTPHARLYAWCVPLWRGPASQPRWATMECHAGRKESRRGLTATGGAAGRSTLPRRRSQGAAWAPLCGRRSRGRYKLVAALPLWREGTACCRKDQASWAAHTRRHTALGALSDTAVAAYACMAQSQWPRTTTTPPRLPAHSYPPGWPLLRVWPNFAPILMKSRPMSAQHRFAAA